jgi:predicted nucleic acid-binding protein
VIAIDTCVVIAFLEGDDGEDVDAFAALLASEQAVLAPSAVTELLSDPKGGKQAAELVGRLKQLSLEEGYWERAGAMRAKVRRSGRKAALGDALMAQACLDADVPLLTRDADFRAFASLAGLKLA